MKSITMALCCAAAAAVVALPSCKKERQNPFMSEYATPYGIPPFDQIEIGDYAPAFEAGLAEARASLDSIVNNQEDPTFENTILPLSTLSPTLERVMSVLGSLSEADSSDELQAVVDSLMPKYTAFSDEISMNPRLFARIKALYKRRDATAAPEERRAIEKAYRDFVFAGALLSPQAQDSLKAINGQLTDLYLKFNKNLLDANNAFAIIVDKKEELAGLPQTTIDAAAEEAKSRGQEGKWAFTLHAPSRLAVLQYADNRGLREKMWRGYTDNAKANLEVIPQIVKARAEKARLLGYPDFASYSTAQVMAKTPQAAEELLLKIWEPAKGAVAREVAEMQALADQRGDSITIAPWDYYYYTDRLRSAKYNLDEAAIAPYFAADSVRKGIFTMANRLYGLTFEEMPDAPKYHPDVKVYDVKDAQGNHLAVFMTDYYTRASKRQGAWMEELSTSWVNPDSSVVRPVVYNVCNFPKPTADAPSLLSIDDVQTAFHEFGHALHGMLSRARLKSQSGTSVDRDFVEFPSQFHEHWAFEPELLKEYAHHYKTGELIPDSLVEKINASSLSGSGFRTAELAGAALLDLYWAQQNPKEGENVDAAGFEQQVSEKLGMPAQLTYRYRSPYFKHIFGSDGYAAGYYTYLWAEVLDADAYQMFRDAGSPFDAEAAAKVQKVLEAGDSRDAMELFVEMRGHAPEPDALLRQRGLE